MNKLTYILSLTCSLAVLSCTKTETPSIIVDKTEINAEFGGLEETIGVKCNRDWVATADVDWITMSHASEEAFEAPSYILVTIQANNGEIRTGTISIESRSGELKASVIVKQGENTEIIRTGDRFVEYLNLVKEGKATDGFRLGADIDLAGKTLPEIAEMTYAFDGQNHTIKNWTASCSMFGKIGSGASVRNIVIDASCALTMPSAEGNFGFIATENNGTIDNVINAASASVLSLGAGSKGMICGINAGVISNCKNKGNLVAATTEVMEKDLCVGGVAGVNAAKAKMNACVNEGAVTVSLAGSKTLATVAGVVGRSESEMASCSNSGAVSLFCESTEGKADGCYKAVSVAGVAGILAWENGKASDWANTGNITFRGGYTLGVHAVGPITKFTSNAAGIVGAAYKCAFENCINKGKITSHIGDIGNTLSVYQTTSRQSAAGVVSSPWGKLTNCVNEGEVDVDWVTKTHDAGLVKQFVGQIGGVVGGDYNSDTKSSSLEKCTNSGKINIVCDAAQSNNAFGGVTGWGGAENAGGVNVLKGCKNTAQITLDGYSKTRLGGISGSPVKIENCVNTGEVYLKGGLANCSVGGICGFGNFFNIIDSESYGALKSEVKLSGTEASAAGGLGGLVGAAGNTQMAYTGCKVDCTISAPAGSVVSMLVGVIGHNKSGGKSFAVGTAASPDKIKGTVNGVTVTEENYQTYMRRPDFKLVNANVTFNVEYLK